MAEHDFNTLMAALDSPLIVVTAADERERAGCLVEFHVQSSIEPQRYCVWLSKANYTYRVALHSSHLVIHFLTVDDLPLAELFGTQTGDTVDKFAGLPVDSGPGGAPVLGYPVAMDNYTGYDRTENFASPGGAVPGRPHLGAYSFTFG
jgi:flavin reductase (DIM6/NTAB) family NADH-FMN oxidoreductase RutF